MEKQQPSEEVQALARAGNARRMRLIGEGMDGKEAYYSMLPEELAAFRAVAAWRMSRGRPAEAEALPEPQGPNLSGNGELELTEVELADEARLAPRKYRPWGEKHRNAVFDIFGPYCVITQLPNLEGGRGTLEVMHLRSVDDCGDDVKGCKANRFNGVPAAGTIHDLYDAGYLALSDRGQLLYSSAISDLDLGRAGLDRHRTIFVQPWTEKHAEFARYHRQHRFIP